ncbi:MAG: hypothetical protein AB1750_07045 [Chloroflexota bacterium]
MSKNSNPSQIKQVEDGVYEIPVQLAESLESQRPILQETLLAAQRRLRGFAQKHNWQQHTQEPFAKQFRVFVEKKSFDHNLLEICGLDTSIELPATSCAALEQEVLLSVSPELYRALYPEGDEENAFEKLLTHEMAHRLHIRILKGDENAMGAVWFFEGFALYAAGQFEKSAPELSATEIWDIAHDPERGSYKKYAAVFLYFARKASIHQLVENAAKDEFLDWLKEVGQ